jgi:phosphatidylserine/phosphatidylglycerophosphate/cardiolipin synthase-like enzyme
MFRVVGTLALLLSSCALEREPEPRDPAVAEALRMPGAGPVRAALVIYPLDVWAQPLARGFALGVTSDGADVPLAGPNPYVVPLRDAQRFTVSLDAPNHHAIDVDVVFDGGASADSLVILGQRADDAISVAHDRERLDGRDVWIHRVYLGLRHRWFSSSGRPARRDNAVDLLIGGEEAWASAHADFERAQDSILVTTWWWESDFELVRDTLSDPETRRANTILEVLRRSPAHKRVIVGQLVGQDGLASWITSDSDLREHGDLTGDGFELMGQANPARGRFWFEVSPFYFGDRVVERVPYASFWNYDFELALESEVPPHSVDLTRWPVSVDVEHASYHQKFLVIDHSVAYVGGMNFRYVDWDTARHRVFDARRMELDASDSERLAVAERRRLPDAGPRRDYMLRIEGPAAQDVAEVFQQRWDYLRDIGARWSQNTTSFDVERDLEPLSPGVEAQITTTMPAPFHEHSIAETWFNAIANAEQFIYIEDQYFRIPMLIDAIIDRMYEKPELRLVVVTKPVSEWSDPGCFWTHRTHYDLRGRFGDRYLLLQAKAWDVRRDGFGIDETDEVFTNVDLHSKMLIVDDVFMSVGSANKNNRGIVYEGEMNVAILDADWVRSERRRILANLLGPSFTVTDDPAQWFRTLRLAADWNQFVLDSWARAGGDLNLNGAAVPSQYVPRGLLYPLLLASPSECLFESIGPDMV